MGKTQNRILLNGDAASVRDHVLCGVWGREVHLIDGDVKYARAPEGDNAPLSMWSNRWSTMPVPGVPEELLMPRPDGRAFLDRMPGSDVPVLRQPFRPGDLIPFWGAGRFSGSHLYDLREDPAEERNLAGSARETQLAERLRAALVEVDAPADQLERLGLA